MPLSELALCERTPRRAHLIQGAGYTTFWLLRALSDAVDEAVDEREDPAWTLWNSDVGKAEVERAAQFGTYSGTGEMLREQEGPIYSPKLYCVDSFDTGHLDRFDEFEAKMASVCPRRELFDLAAADWLEWRESFSEEKIDFLW